MIDPPGDAAVQLSIPHQASPLPPATSQPASASEIVWLVTMEIEGGEKPALVAEWITRFY